MRSKARKELSNGQWVCIGVVVLLLAIAFGSCANSTNTAAAPDPYKNKFLNVAAVLDAATIQLADGRRIRQLGILAPDSGTCEAKQALTSAQSMVGPAHPVSLEFEPGVSLDQFGNQWAYIKYGANQGGVQTSDFGIDSAQRGWVTTYPTWPDIPTYEDQIRNALYAAQHSATGRWSSLCRPIEPAPVAPTSPTSTNKTDIDIHHHNMPDGLLTGGYCARKWWC